MDIDSLFVSFQEVQFHSPSVGVILSAILAAVLILVSGFASGSEIAFFSLSPNDLNEMDTERNTADSHIQMLRNDSERTLATILITNNLVNVTIIMLCKFIFDHIVDFGNAHWLQFICITVLLTFLLLLFGEIIPKIFSRQDPLHFCRRFVGSIVVLRKIFWPLSSILLQTRVVFEKLFQKQSHVLSVGELEQALELTDNNDIKDEKSMLQGIIRFGDETVNEVMTRRQDVVDLSIKSTYQEVLACIVENNYSRIPVYQDNSDNIRGILYVKDLLPHLNKPSTFRWQTLVRPPYFVPNTKKIDDLLREFQKNRVHIAIVVDEFGGTCGIVTLEDILEEIVGEIHDEYDEEEKTFVRLNKDTYVFEGKTPLSNFCEMLHVDDEIFETCRNEADTLAGLLLEIKGDFPVIHEKLEYKNYQFEVLQLEKRRISRVKVTVKEPDSETNKEE
ncbi:MAG: gliding motility-associated protein GldE [Prevotellaceae bacterium]|nr:gliding motility-associated protein GldE [Prevotellaceae bacterium]MDY6130385.1 gliding motility-associated protein GldE [Prevotella sp.]